MIDRTKAPEIHSLPAMTMPEPDVINLPSGVKLATLRGGDDDIWRMTAVIDGGVAEGPNDYYPALAATLLREGTAAMTAPEVADALDFNGSWYVGAALSHHITATVSGLTSRFEPVLPIFHDILTTPIFSERETAIGVQQLAQRLEIDQQRVKWHASQGALAMAMGATHPLAVVGSPDDIRATTAADLRSYYSRILTPDRLTLMLAGRFSDEQVGLVTDAFAKMTPGGEGRSEYSCRPFSYTTGTRVDIPVPGAQQSAVSMVLPAPLRTDPDYILLRIAVMALGGYFGSRLMANVREDKGLTYGITAQLMGYPEGGIIKIDAQTSAEHVEQLIDETRREIERMASEPLAVDELDRLRRHYTTTLVAQLDSPLTMADCYLNRITAGIPADYFMRQQEVLRQLTPEMLVNVSKRYLLPELLSVAVAG